LYSRRGAAVTFFQCAVNYVELVLPLVQAQLEVGLFVRVVHIDGAPLNIENAIRGGAGD
jgi:hypothetical protein